MRPEHFILMGMGVLVGAVYVAAAPPSKPDPAATSHRAAGHWLQAATVRAATVRRPPATVRSRPTFGFHPRT